MMSVSEHGQQMVFNQVLEINVFFHLSNYFWAPEINGLCLKKCFVHHICMQSFYSALFSPQP